MELMGKYGKAKVFTDEVESSAISQIIEMLNQPYAENANIRIMPDVHAGAGCTIGTTMLIKDQVCPNLVGVDIGCLDEHSEYLTPKGWKKIKDFNLGDEVLGYDKKSGKATFTIPLAYIKQPCDYFYSFRDERNFIDQMLSKEHRILAFQIDPLREDVTDSSILKKSTVLTPEELNIRIKKKENWRILTTFHKEQTTIELKGTEDAARLAVMAALRGEIVEERGSKYHFIFKFNLAKDEEYAERRCALLLRRNRYRFTQYEGQEKDIVIIDTWLPFNKDLTKFYSANSELLYEVKIESVYCFNSIDVNCGDCKQNADVLQFAFAASGEFATIEEKEGCYYVIPQLINTPYFSREGVRAKSLSGYKYCFTMPTGFFVARRNGRIFITGNCGMTVSKIQEKNINLKKLDEIIHNSIPSGNNIREKSILNHEQSLSLHLKELNCFKQIQLERSYLSLGTLGGGNHFIELDKDKEDNLFLVIHSGSRHLGLEVASYYQKLAIKNMSEENQLYQKRKRTIQVLKEKGEFSKIQETLKKIEINNKHLKVPKELMYLEGNLKDYYLEDMRIAQNYAKRNRDLIVETILKNMGLHEVSRFHTIHNYIDLENMILRKGAVSAKKRERLIIPLNMRDGSLICEGLGNKDWNYSAPHGAGRIMSRSQAKENLSMKDFESQMEGIYSTSINKNTLDESPMAYKSKDNIIDNIGDTVSIISIIKPIYNFKAC